MESDHVIWLDGGVGLAAAVPHFLSFHPLRSLILACFVDDSYVFSGRLDLTEVGQHAGTVRDAVRMVRSRHVDEVCLVIVDDVPERDPLPHGELVSKVRSAVAEVTGNDVHAVWASSTHPGGIVRCYDDLSCGGTIPDAPGDLAVLGVLMGKVVYDTREDIAALLDPADHVVVERRSRMLNELMLQQQSTGWDYLRSVREAIVSPPKPDDDRQLVRLGIALSDYRVRDAVMRLCLLPGGERAEQLWLTLARELPAPERAEPAVLVAVSAWMRGNGALASIALDVATRALPGHAVVQLLRAWMTYALPLADARETITDIAMAALRDLESEEPEQPPA